MKPKRQLELDLFKALIVPLMIVMHIAETVFSRQWEDMQYCIMTPGRQVLMICLNIVVAFGFMFSMGAAIPFSSNRDPEQKIKRGFMLIIKWFLLNLWIMIPLGIRFAKYFGLTFWQFYGVSIFSSDILCFAGLFFVYYGLLSRCKRISLPMFVAISACLFGLGHLASYRGEALLVQHILGHFVVSEASVFPFLNWIMAPVLGLCWGKLLKRTENQDRLYAILGIAGAASLAIVLIVLGYKGMLNTENLNRLTDVKTFYDVNIGKLLLSCCLLSVLLSIAYWITRIFRSTRFQNVYTSISVNLNKLYIIQWVIIPWLAVCIPEPAGKYSLWWAFLLGAGVFTVDLLMVGLMEKIKALHPEKREQ